MWENVVIIGITIAATGLIYYLKKRKQNKERARRKLFLWGMMGAGKSLHKETSGIEKSDENDEYSPCKEAEKRVIGPKREEEK